MQQTGDVQFFLRKRYLVIVLIFFGHGLYMLLSANFSICLVDMTSTRSEVIGNITHPIKPEFNFSSVEEGLLLSLISWGLMISPFAAVMAIKFGGVITFGYPMMMIAIFTILSPILVKWSIILFGLGRVIEGLLQALTGVSSIEIYIYWVPPDEKFRLMSLGLLGYQFGSTISYPLCGFMAYYYGWRGVFYITGAITMVWFVIWILLLSNTPEKDKLITAKERKYLIDVVQVEKKPEKMIYPWRKILTSKAVWAYCNGRFVEAINVSLLMSCIPLYFEDAYNTDIQNIGLLSSIPQAVGMLSLTFGGFVADYLRTKMTTTAVHKTFITTVQVISAITIFLIAFTQDLFVCSIGLCVYKLFSNFEAISFTVLPIDMASVYGSVIMGMGCTSMGLGLAINPLIMGVIVKDHTLSQWSLYFFALSAINAFGGIVFLWFGSGDLEPWARINSDENKLPAREIDNTTGESTPH